MLLSGLIAAAAVVPGIPATPAPAPEPAPVIGAVAPVSPVCSGGACQFRLSADEMVSAAERMVMEGQYAAAAPLVAALGTAPDYQLQHRFLSGMIALGQGDYPTAERWFRAILDDSPRQSRVRLELARTLLLMGKESAADYHLRLVEDEEDLPEEISRTIRSTRGIIRDSRIWHFNFDVGFAPDTNINNATDAETVDVNFGSFRLPLTLNDDARRKSGLGQTGNYNGGVRLRMDDGVAMLIESEGRFVNYSGSATDDFDVQIAVGPELRAGTDTMVSIQGFGDYRWYGGDLATREFGVRMGAQRVMGAGQRIGVRVDGRRTLSGYGNAFDGWSYGGGLTYERVIARSFIASASIFAQRSDLNDDSYSYLATGVSLGVGGELPLGINAGISGSVSHAGYKAPMLMYSSENREDWRYSSRIYMGLRNLRVMGFSPSVDYVFTKVDSNYDIYKSERHRVNFKLSRYF